MLPMKPYSGLVYVGDRLCTMFANRLLGFLGSLFIGAEPCQFLCLKIGSGHVLQGRRLPMGIE